MLSSLSRLARPSSALRAIPALPFGNSFNRSFHFQWNFRFKDYKKEESLLKEANASPLDADKQYPLLMQINTHNPSRVIERVESGLYANNEFTLREYIKALYKENRLDQLSLSSMVQVPNILQASGGSGFNSPLRMQVVRGKWENILYALTFLGATAFIIYMFDTNNNSQADPLFNVPPAHGKVKDSPVKFDDVKGVDECKAELQEIVEYLKDPSKFASLGAKLPKGVLMSGPPGTGKTMLAKALAGEAGVPFLYCSGSSFDEIFVGVGSSRVRQLFKEASAQAPCIVFIDEIDAVGGTRTSFNKDNTLQQLLTELDGFNSSNGVVVIAATNTPESLDSALVRPGRFDRHVYVPLPDVKGRKQIFDLYLKKVKVSDSVNSDILARSTPGFSGADISQLINASAIKAAVHGREEITMDLIDEAKDDTLMGRMRKSVIIDEKTRKMTAYHEGGHALVAHFTEGADPVHKATIIQRGDALGMVKQLPTGDQLSYSRKQMEARLAVLMAGRAAEEIIYGGDEVTSGASGDLKQATKLAKKMVMEWGMSEKVGLMYVDKMGGRMEEVVEEEVKEMLKTKYDYAKKVLVEHKEELELLVKTLLEKETLSGSEIKDLFTKPTLLPTPIPTPTKSHSLLSSLSSILPSSSPSLSPSLSLSTTSQS